MERLRVTQAQIVEGHDGKVNICNRIADEHERGLHVRTINHSFVPLVNAMIDGAVLPIIVLL